MMTKGEHLFVHMYVVHRGQTPSPLHNSNVQGYNQKCIKQGYLPCPAVVVK